MAENDTHYNDIPGENTQAGKDAAPAGNDYGLTTPLPDFEEGGPVYPDNIPDQNAVSYTHLKGVDPARPRQRKTKNAGTL